MKKYNILTAIFIGMFMHSCSDDFLILDPVDQSSVSAFYRTESDFEAAILGMYGNFREATVMPPMLTEYRSDNFTHFQYFGYELGENDLSPNIASYYWDMYRTLIYPSNLIVQKLDEIGDGISADVADRIRGEALFFRGYAYYWINLMIGGVPLVTRPITTDEALAMNRSSEDDVWAQISDDFSEASDLLSGSPLEFGRIDKYGAMGFEAKSLLQQNRWTEAAAVLEEVYDNSGYSLEPVWSDMWETDAQKTSDEIMVSSIWSDLIPNNEFGQSFIYIPNSGSIGQGNFTYKPGLYDSFDDNDVRKAATVGYETDGRSLNNKYDFGRVGNNWTMDIILLRFTDIVLMYAEALTMSEGSVQQLSVDLLNMTRTRAGLSTLTLTDIPNIQSFVETILAERRSEFLFEGSRYADLKRHDLLLEKLGAIGYDFDESYLYLPIPQVELDKMPNLK